MALFNETDVPEIDEVGHDLRQFRIVDLMFGGVTSQMEKLMGLLARMWRRMRVRSSGKEIGGAKGIFGRSKRESRSLRLNGSPGSSLARKSSPKAWVNHAAPKTRGGKRPTWRGKPVH